MSTAWLIETTDPVATVLYFCADGDWCSNPNHAHKFRNREDAERKMAGMQRPDIFRVAEHAWVERLG